ncbi:MAG: homoserine O-succinyltransferase, partial [Proteobacteria bacterium]|nr:homoserine O-succinyltransferase [Pseudomonadota bacterium]
RLIGSTPLQIEFSLIRMSEHQTKNTAASHMEEFYKSFAEVKNDKFDGLIITGAPIEHLAYSDVSYWTELCEVFDWSQTNIHSTLGVCWGGMAMTKYFHGIDKQMLDEKAFGCFRHTNLKPSSPYLRGFSDDCIIPVSRWTEIKQADIEKTIGLETLLLSQSVGPCLVKDSTHRALYIFNHLEYDSLTLSEEYHRDIEDTGKAEFPKNYFPNDDPSKTPNNRWRSHAHLLYGNWVNEIYQTTPYNLKEIGSP